MNVITRTQCLPDSELAVVAHPDLRNAAAEQILCAMPKAEAERVVREVYSGRHVGIYYSLLMEPGQAKLLGVTL